MLGGRSLPHALMMMIPEAWEGRDDLPPEVRDFYAYHSCLMEPWDGPAAVAFSDGRLIGATLDRNGLRPGRWQVTRDGFVVLASETGVLEAPAEEVVQKGRLQPGKLFLVDVEEGRIIEDGEIKHEIATRKPYGNWYRTRSMPLDELEEVAPRKLAAEPLGTRQRLFGYTQEDLRVTLAQMGGSSAAEPIGSMGNDFALAVLSDRGPLLYSYFKQLFAQVTNPPIDPIREELVMSLSTHVGPGGEPARRDGRARAPARDLRSRCSRAASSRSCARSTTTCSARTRWTPPGRSARARRDSRARSTGSATRRRRWSRWATTS